MKIKKSTTRKVNIKPSSTRKINPEIIAEALGAELICDNQKKDNEEDKQKELDNYWARREEIKKILSETDPQKYPNSIPEKILSSEEKLELIEEIVSELCMDFSDAEHQIDYHADTLVDNYRDLMKAMNKIHHTICMSVEQMNKMNW